MIMIYKKSFAMIISIVIGLICFSSVQSESSMNMGIIHDVSSSKMALMDSGLMSKEKRYLNHQLHDDGSPCPPFYPNLGMHIQPASFSKPYGPPSYPRKMMPVPQISYQPMPQTYIHRPIQPDWQPPQQIWQPMRHHQSWQPQVSEPKVIVQKPVYSYAPMYHQPPMQPHYMQNLIKVQQPEVYQKQSVLYKPCAPMPCAPRHNSIPSHQPQSQIKYVQPQQPSISYLPGAHSRPIHSAPHYLAPTPTAHKMMPHVGGWKDNCAK